MLFVSCLGIIAAIVLLVDPSLYMAYHSLKNLALIALIPLALVIHSALQLARRDESVVVVVSWVELFLALRLVWAVLASPQLLSIASDNELFLLAALLILTFLIRQAAYACDSSLKYSRLLILLRLIWIMGLVQAVIGLFQYSAYHDEFVQRIKTPMIGTIGAANGFGLFGALAIIAAIAEFAGLKKRSAKVFMGIALSVMFGSFLLNGSRGAFLALASSATAVSCLVLIKKHKTKPITVLTSSAIILLIVLLCLYNLNVESASGRVLVWRISSPMFLDHPFTGVGYGRFGAEYLNYQERYFQDSTHLDKSYKAASLRQAHNEFLQAFLETGIPGGLIFLALWLSAVWISVKKSMNCSGDLPAGNLALMSIIIAIAVHSTVDNPLRVLPLAVLGASVLGMLSPDIFSYQFEIKSRWVKLVGVIASFGLFVFAVQRCWGQYAGYSEWKQGIQLSEDSQWQEAKEHLEHALVTLPDRGELRFHLGVAVERTGDYARAITLLRESSVQFNDRSIYLYLAHANLRLDSLASAKFYAIKASTMFPDQLAPHLLLGEIYYLQGDKEKSKGSLLKCIRGDTHIKSERTEKIQHEASILYERYFETSPELGR